MIAIIALLAALLLPSLSRARQVAVRVACLGRERQVFLAAAAYGNDAGDYPATGNRQAYNVPWGDPVPTSSSDPNFIHEKDGFGFSAFTEMGPYQLLRSTGYAANYAYLQCPVKPPFPLWGRHGYTPSGGIYGDGYWYGYNGPNVHGPAIYNYGQNGGLSILGGHHPWVNASFGLSLREAQPVGRNAYRSGPGSPSDFALLACPAFVQSLTSGGAGIAEREPHMEMPVSSFDDYFNIGPFQTDGPISSAASNWKVARNYIFGDGHGTFIYRQNRGYSTADGF